MHPKKNIYLILGISSAGKSTYIENNIKKKFKDIPIYLAHEINESNYKDIFRSNCIIHYNLFRPFKNSADNIHTPITDDIISSYLLEYSTRIKATLLIAPLSIIAKRILLRKIAEPNLRKKTPSKYPKHKLFELLHSIDYLGFHQQWIHLLKKHRIPTQIFYDSQEITNRLTFNEILQSNIKADYSEAEITEIAKDTHFEYQQILLPSQQLTTGNDRSATFEIIKKEITLIGKTVLDIGCAYGYFCFQSEKAGAKYVQGSELKRHRFIGCNILKHIFASDCEFTSNNIFMDKEPTKKYDIIFLLNVIHHLPEPIHALRKIAERCNEVLIIEFPTLMDKKFNNTLDSSTSQIDNSLPLIGVSLLADQDQTFLFTQMAIERILLDNNKLFNSIDFLASPISDDRLIAICRK
jgi:2-polyprenyl-3-methyl-5-hydroxy-6-metoxy-1,4-benzoquinol methylase